MRFDKGTELTLKVVSNWDFDSSPCHNAARSRLRGDHIMMYITTMTILFLFSGTLYESRSPVREFSRRRLIIGTKSRQRKQYGIDVTTTSSRTPNERGMMIATEPAQFSNRKNAIILRFMAVYPSVRYARAVALESIPESSTLDHVTSSVRAPGPTARGHA